jgi:hypothetical protein
VLASERALGPEVVVAERELVLAERAWAQAWGLVAAVRVLVRAWALA